MPACGWPAPVPASAPSFASPACVRSAPTPSAPALGPTTTGASALALGPSSFASPTCDRPASKSAPMPPPGLSACSWPASDVTSSSRGDEPVLAPSSPPTPAVCPSTCPSTDMKSSIEKPPPPSGGGGVCPAPGATGLFDGAGRCTGGVCCVMPDDLLRFTVDRGGAVDRGGGVAVLVPAFHGSFCGLAVVDMPAPPGSITVITSKVTNAASTPSALTVALGRCVGFGRRHARTPPMAVRPHAADGRSSSAVFRRDWRCTNGEKTVIAS